MAMTKIELIKELDLLYQDWIVFGRQTNSPTEREMFYDCAAELGEILIEAKREEIQNV